MGDEKLTATRPLPVVEIGGAEYSHGALTLNQRTGVTDLTPAAERSALAVARAKYVEPVRAVMVGYLFIATVVSAFAVGLAVVAVSCRWPWQIVVSILALLVWVAGPPRALTTKLVEHVLKPKSAGE